MTRNQTELFKNASPIAEKKIRQARAMQAAEMRDMVKNTFRAIASRFRRNAATPQRNAEV